nr:ABC transporter ATP-binding protein [Fodinicola acaciae]
MEAPLLEVDNLTVTFPTPDGPATVVRGVSFTLAEREVFGVVGESGSGKSVTSLAMLGLLPPAAVVTGSARLRGTELLGLPARELDRVRGKDIAMIFQDPMTALNPVYRVGDQIAEAARAHNSGMSARDARKRAVEMLDLVGIPAAAERARAYPHQFSGGMRQRVMIAMAMVNDPAVLIADEPTTALDVTVQAQLLETLDRLREKLGISILLISHDLGVIAQLASRVMVMYAGRPVETGPTSALFGAPGMPYTRGLLASLPRVGERGHRLVPIPGQPPSMLSLTGGCPFEPRCERADAECSDEPALEPLGIDRFAACHHPLVGSPA